MSALQRLSLVLVMVVVGCKGKSSEPATGSGSAVATPSGSAAASGSAADPGSAAAAKPAEADTAAKAPPAAAKLFDGPTFTITSTLSGPDTKTKDIDTEAGKTTMTMYEFSDPADDDVVQMVESNPVKVTGGTEEKVMEGSFSGMTENVKAVIDDKKTVKVDGVSMIDFASHFNQEGNDYFFRGRVAFKKGMLYQVAAMGKGTKPSASAEQFVGSFHLK